MPYNRKDLIRSFVGTLTPSDRVEWFKHRKAADESCYFFNKYVLGWLPKAGGYITEEIHKPVLDAWGDPSNLREAAFLPRGWAKSTTRTIGGSLWDYLHDNETRILIPSEKAETAQRWVGQIGSQVVRNERLRWVYPELQYVTKGYIKTHRFSTKAIELPRAGAYPEATIQCVGVKGASQGGHFNTIAIDDLVGEKGFESPVVMEDAFRWFDNVEELLIQPDMGAKNPSKVHITGTSWGMGDFGEYVKEEYPEYKWIIVPALKDSALVDTDSVTWLQREDVEPGESNWPEVFSTKHYVDMRANPEKELVFYAQHMNNPHAATTMKKFDTSWLRYYRFEDRPNDEGYPEKWVVSTRPKEDPFEYRVSEMQIWAFIDPGGFSEMKMIKRGSRNAILIAGQPPTSHRKFVLATWAERLTNPDIFLDQMFKMQDEWHPRVWMVETFGAQKYIYKDILSERDKRGARSYLSVQELPRDVSKDVKASDILSLLAPMQNGEMYVHQSMKNLIYEIRDYPNSLTVDLIDLWGKCMKLKYKRTSPEAILKLNTPRLSEYDAIEAGASDVCGY